MKSLGIDLGTNSIGWAIVDEAAEKDKIQDCGVTLFPEGVKIEKGNESSKAAERTGYRLARRQKFRRKLRKARTLKVLAANGMCPITIEEIDKWTKQKEYPSNQEFIKWYRTDEKNNWEPYYLRKKCVEQRVSPTELGRALYHIAQRRGFLSNRKDTTQESDGVVTKGIDEITNAMADKTLGQYFYELKKQGIKVRARYTSRKEHYLKEFEKICEVQSISKELKNELLKAIFYQRPLKSQKFLVGKCTLEPNKPRCPISHFEFEEYRMLSFINNIRVKRKTIEDEDCEFEPLTKNEIEIAKEKFYRKSKPNFDFEDISKAIKGKQNQFWEFNYPDFTNVAGCPVSAALKEIFGDNWPETKIDNYDIYDIWHVLFDFDSDEKLEEFAKDKLHLNEEQTKSFLKIRLPQGYASLSLKAIRKILVFLREGFIYTEAVFLANIPTIIGADVFAAHKDEIVSAVSAIIDKRKEANNIIAIANECIRLVCTKQDGSALSEEWDKTIVEEQAKQLFGLRNWNNKSESVKNNIIEGVTEKVNQQLSCHGYGHKLNDILLPSYRIDEQIEYQVIQKYGRQNKKDLYHPSDNDDKFKKEPVGKDGKKYLGSPNVPSVKNPVVMRTLHQLRKLINYLIKVGKIDEQTKVKVELANEVNDKNMRSAIHWLQSENEKINDEYRKELVKAGIANPTKDDIRKYRLWEEQGKICFYTGEKINFNDLFGENPKFDFEHTIPRSLSFDNSLENLTLCNSDYNRNIKKQQIPTQLPDYQDIKTRVEYCYNSKIKQLNEIIQRNKSRGGYSSADEKDNMIRKRNKAKLELAYYKGKLDRFKMTDVNSGFKHSQLNDTRTITKFALRYLKTVFDYVMPVKGEWTAEFRKQWGIQEYDEEKNRNLQTHHTADAITIACVDRDKYNLLNEVAHNNKNVKIKIPAPWETFSDDVKQRLKFVFPKYENKDVALKTTKKKQKDKRTGKIIPNKNGDVVYIQGDTARGSLHKDTFYGKIQDPADKKIKCVVKKPIAGVKVDDIVDARIRRIYNENIEKHIQSKPEIEKDGLLMPFTNQGRPIYVKKVRVFDRTQNPIPLKSHRDKSKYEYKQQYYVQNDSNYMLAIYRGVNAKGKEVSDYVLLNLLDAVPFNVFVTILHIIYI